MPSKSLLDFIIEILKMYGPLGFTIIVLICLLIYQAKQKEKEREEFREDFRQERDKHRADIDKQNQEMISSSREQSKMTGQLTVAINTLSIHVQNCQKV